MKLSKGGLTIYIERANHATSSTVPRESNFGNIKTYSYNMHTYICNHTCLTTLFGISRIFSDVNYIGNCINQKQSRQNFPRNPSKFSFVQPEKNAMLYVSRFATHKYSSKRNFINAIMIRLSVKD